MPSLSKKEQKNTSAPASPSSPSNKKQQQEQPLSAAAAPSSFQNNVVSFPIPSSIRDVDNGRILGFGAYLAPDHPVSCMGREEGSRRRRRREREREKTYHRRSTSKPRLLFKKKKNRASTTESTSSAAPASPTSPRPTSRARPLLRSPIRSGRRRSGPVSSTRCPGSIRSRRAQNSSRPCRR